MYNLKLDLWERIQLEECLPRDASWSEMEQLVRISKLLSLTDEEKLSIDYKTVKVQTHQGAMEGKAWDNDKMARIEQTEIKLKVVDFERLRKAANARTNWPRTDNAGLRVLALKAKFDAAVED